MVTIFVLNSLKLINIELEIRSNYPGRVQEKFMQMVIAVHPDHDFHFGHNKWSSFRGR